MSSPLSETKKDMEIIKWVSRTDTAFKHLKKLLKKSDSKPEPKSKQSNPMVQEILKFFAEKYDQIKGLPYSVNWGKDGSLVKRLLVDYSPEGLKGLIEHYLKMPDEFFASHGFSLPIFVSQIAKIAYDLKGKEDGPKTHYR